MRGLRGKKESRVKAGKKLGSRPKRGVWNMCSSHHSVDDVGSSSSSPSPSSSSPSESLQVQYARSSGTQLSHSSRAIG